MDINIIISLVNVIENLSVCRRLLLILSSLSFNVLRTASVLKCRLVWVNLPGSYGIARKVSLQSKQTTSRPRRLTKMSRMYNYHKSLNPDYVSDSKRWQTTTGTALVETAAAIRDMDRSALVDDLRNRKIHNSKSSISFGSTKVRVLFGP